MKKEKTMKVYAISTYPNYKVVPQIRLQGEWVRNIGFEEGNEISVEYSEKKIVIRRKNEEK